MSVTVKLNYIRHSARKLQPVTRMFTGKPLNYAIDATNAMPQHSAQFLRKALLMAKAAATQRSLNVDDLVVAQAFATIGPKIKRMRPNARGRSNKYQKHIAHLVVVLDQKKEAVKKLKTTKVEK